MRNDRPRIAQAFKRLGAACVLTLALLADASVLAGVPAAQKMKPEEVVAKHLEALGTADARKPGRSRVVAGASIMDIKTGARGQTSGPSLIASQGDKVLVKAEFDSPSYPFEKLGFDGKKFSSRPYAPGARSPVALFFQSHDAIFSEGLIGGALSTAWPLLNLAERKAKVEYAGSDKHNGRPVHKLRYIPKEGSELKIKLWFDAETFRHIRTEYERVIPAPMGATPQQSASQREVRYKLVEDFSDFKPEGGLTLPHSYKLQYALSMYNPLQLEWTFSLEKFTFDFPIEAKEFVADN